MKSSKPPSRIPMSLVKIKGDYFVRWMFRGRRILKAPFFDNNFSLQSGQKLKMASLAKFSQISNSLPIAGFIFHSGRCGSTLLVRMLQSFQDCLVISEPSLVNKFLLDSKRMPRIDRVRTLRLILQSFSQTCSGREKKLFFKLTSFNTLDAELILEAFPDVPWIYLTRDPVYTLSSQLLRPSRWSPTAYAVLATDKISRLELRPNPWSKENLLSQQRILTRSFRLMCALQSKGRGLVLQYHQIKNGISPALEKHFGLHITKIQAAQIAKVLKFDAKSNKPTVFNAQKGRQRTPQIQPFSLPGYSVLMQAFRNLIRFNEVRKP
jgi:hypothetical protein